MRKFLILATLCAASIFSAHAAHAARIALVIVIGNSAYTSRPLDNPVNDARAMAGKLQSLGFTVIKKENLRQREIGAVLRELRSKVKAGDDVLVFYAGHGLQVKGENYLPAVDADIQSEDDVPLQSLSLNQLLTVLDDSKAGVKLLFLDACRDNPFARSFRSGAGGDLGRISNAPSGTLIHYATRPGSVAADGRKGGNGLYTENLLKHISEQGVAIEAMHKRVSAGVRSASLGKQEPWTEGQLEGEYYFGGAGTQIANTFSTQMNTPAIRLQSAEEIEQQAWDATQQANTLAAFNAYLAEYPSGRFASSARIKVAGLQPLASPPVASNHGAVKGDAVPYGAIRSSKSGLIWQRCSVGQTWDGRWCSGEPQKFSFQQVQLLSKDGWRVPSLRELASLVECSSGQSKESLDAESTAAPLTIFCLGDFQTPSINKPAFPNTPADTYWTSTPYFGVTTGARIVSFKFSAASYGYNDSHFYVRLVRSSL